jgi:hypothetical protein
LESLAVPSGFCRHCSLITSIDAPENSGYRLFCNAGIAGDSLEGVLCCGLSWNPHIYVRDNPVNAIDPTGRDAFEEYHFLSAEEVSTATSKKERTESY